MMTDEIALTRELAQLANTPLPPAVDEALVTLAPSLIEWSLNVGDERRGRFRLSAWSDEPARVETVLGRLAATAARRWHDAVPHEASSGLGWQLTAGAPPKVRWWQLAPTGDGRALFQAALGHAPELSGAG
ncbi:MAG: hypothetical protein H0T79_08135, partial [Deltaproteobacteria bacterium]|nr:hypothetical protein [Deltaproteobacteria bacterium]